MNPRFRFILRKNSKAFTKTKTLTKTNSMKTAKSTSKTQYFYKTDSSAKSSNRESV